MKRIFEANNFKLIKYTVIIIPNWELGIEIMTALSGENLLFKLQIATVRILWSKKYAPLFRICAVQF